MQPGISLVYLGKNDDDREMQKMCAAIGRKLERARIPAQAPNTDGQVLPKANTIERSDVWLCGHSRFIEANTSVRSSGERNLGGFPLKDVATFLALCVENGVKRIRLICCESAQQQRHIPNNAGTAPSDRTAVLGKEVIHKLGDWNFTLMNNFNGATPARASHLEMVIYSMARDLSERRKREHKEFEICGLWGAGDITDDDVPITSFLQDGGSLEAQSKMDKSPAHKKTFEDAHCGKKGLPDFFGYLVQRDVLVKWAPT